MTRVEPAPGDPADARPVLVIGGAGFIGCNLAARLVRDGHRVRIYDNLSRVGVEENLDWLLRTYGHAIEPRVADLRDRAHLRTAVADVKAVVHLAAQVAVTTSLVEPLYDFEVNLRGTLEVLEAVRALAAPPPLLFTSTNKVYGALPDVALVEDATRWRPADPALAARGIDERRPLDFHSPYGCSKGGADQYVLDYARTFGLPAAVFRMSCIYGPHQRGTEDQGWVAHFLIRAIAGGALTIYGDGKQVRDLLFVDDLVEAIVGGWRRIDAVRGRAFNLGGGPANALSLLELVAMIERLRGERPAVQFAGWRAGDQRYYVSDAAAFAAATGWRPRIGAHAGVEALYGWLRDHEERT